MQIKPRNLKGSPVDSDPVIDRILRGRGVDSIEAIDYRLSQLLPYHQLKGIHAAADWLYAAMQSGKKVCIIGDYDVDGATSTAVMMKGLAAMGLQDLCYLIPNRIHDGYGLTPALVDRAHAMQCRYIITVDNGIVSFQGVDHAKALGISVLITDHHMATDAVPDCVVVNPNQPGCQFPSKFLAGVGVAYYVLIAFRAKLRESNHEGGKANLLELIDLVALGTVADCVPLDQNNRLMVSQGLSRIHQGKMSDGVKALIDIAKRNPHLLEADDFGFSIAPRLNAAGRLEDMGTGVLCLLAPTLDVARRYATMLDKINLKRREIQAQMLSEATESLRATQVKDERVIILFSKDWHEGVIGLVASMLKEKHHLPTIALAQDSDPAVLKGSCRSIPGLNIRDVLVEFDRRYPDILLKFGGHAMAAGLSLRKKLLPEFKKGMQSILADVLSESLLQKSLQSDGALPSTHRTLPFARRLSGLSPWGQGFEKPLFDDTFDVRNMRKIGQSHLKFELADHEHVFDAVWFSPPEHWLESRHQSLRIIYHLGINDFRGRRQLQLMIQHAEPC